MLSFIQVSKRNITNHTLYWSLFWAVDISFSYAITGVEIRFANLVNPVFFTLFFYTIVYVALIPNLPKNLLKSILWSLIILIAFVFLKYLFKTLIFDNNPTRQGFPFVSFETWRFLNAIFFAIAYWIYIQSMREQKIRYLAEIKLIETQDVLLSTEIKFLKAQINPHFLFNTLNFLYAETYKLSPKVGEGILLLTEIMRYTVQSTTNEIITIEKEAEFLRKYVEIQQLRFHDRLQIVLDINIFSPSVSIPPLIILSFVENAFKYGKINDPNNPLTIKLESSPECIYFYCMNLKNTHFKDPSTAVGIENIRSRLNRYSNNYDLTIKDENSIYTVTLKINLLS
jgi:two-component system LytT family sensor kinase